MLGGERRVGIVLINPRTFLPLLLFIGFFYTLIGLATYKLDTITGIDLPNLFGLGMGMIFIAIVIFLIIIIIPRR